MNRIVAIHQPNFFPWLGYFDKIYRSDQFVVLDDVQYPKTGGSWSNRVRIPVNGAEKWMTVPVMRNFAGVRNICDMQFHDQIDWRAKLIDILSNVYRKAPHFEEIMPFLEPLIRFKDNNLSSYNHHIITTLVEALGMKADKLVLSSTLSSSGTASERLVSLTKSAGGNTYMCGGGAGDYQNAKIFSEAGIKLIHQNFVHPVYFQRGSHDFISGMSIIDPLMNIGLDGVSQLLKRVRRE